MLCLTSLDGLILGAAHEVSGILRAAYFVRGSFSHHSTWDNALGLWLLSGKHRFATWVAVLITFLGFAGISFYQVWIRQASCGCLGRRVTVNPWVMFAIDLAAVAALLVARPDSNPLWVHRGRIVRTGAYILGGYALLLGSLAAFAHIATVPSTMPWHACVRSDSP